MADFSHEQIVRLRTALGRISRQLDRRASADGTTRTQMTVLATVARKGPVTVKELAEVEGLNPTMLSRVLNHLQDAGLVTRTASTDDRRVVEVAVTRAGARRHDRWRTERAALLADHISRIPDEDVRRLLAALPALEHLSEAMQADGTRV
jgi:DNA-binding MarR family transcriptional regulator